MTIRYKVSKNGVFSGPYVPVFSPNTGKYGPEKTPYLDIFRAVNQHERPFITVQNNILMKSATALKLIKLKLWNSFIFGKNISILYNYYTN